MVALFTGLLAAFIFSWPMALCSLFILPLMVIGGIIAAKADIASMGVTETETEDDKTDDEKDSLILAADSI